MRAWRKCLQQRRNVGTCLSSCHLNKHNLIKSLRANLDERTLSSDDALKVLPPKISPFLQEGLIDTSPRRHLVLVPRDPSNPINFYPPTENPPYPGTLRLFPPKWRKSLYLYTDQAADVPPRGCRWHSVCSESKA
jgi:hypothetical protein